MRNALLVAPLSLGNPIRPVALRLNLSGGLPFYRSNFTKTIM